MNERADNEHCEANNSRYCATNGQPLARDRGRVFGESCGDWSGAVCLYAVAAGPCRGALVRCFQGGLPGGGKPCRVSGRSPFRPLTGVENLNPVYPAGDDAAGEHRVFRLCVAGVFCLVFCLAIPLGRCRWRLDGPGRANRTGARSALPPGLGRRFDFHGGGRRDRRVGDTGTDAVATGA
ncbi:hypothetical protein D3C86_1282340 [compost metagenome]